MAEPEGPPYVACQHCTQHCRQIHSCGVSSCSRTPSFFSFLPPFFSSAPFSLPIPPAFLGAKNIRIDRTSAPGERLYSETQLEGPSGATWSVAMQGPSLSSLSFTTGWEKFVKDHSLVAGDLLVFKLLSRGSFSVSIYGTDGCEKAEAFTSQNTVARSAWTAQTRNKRPAVDNVLPGIDGDAGAKRRKMGSDEPMTPLIIDIDDDDDADEVEECAPKTQSSNACQVASSSDIALAVHADIAKSMGDTHMPGAEESLDYCNGDKCSQPTQVDVPLTPTDANKGAPPTPNSADKCVPLIPSNADKSAPLTPSNADKGILTDKMRTVTLINKENGTSDEECCSSTSSSSDESASCSDNHQEKSSESESESDSEKDFEDSLYHTNEATQQDKMNEVAKAYMTEAFISKRRPVSDEERQRALQAAKRFRSNLPHLRKLMKESHVYRGFWLTLSSDFSIKYLPQEIQQATLLDSLGKAWSARWLGRRSGLSGGWRKFSLDHGLEEGDVCVFELIDKKKLVIKVHIFRVVELENGLPGRDHYLHKPQSKPLDYHCRVPCTSVKKMRGAIAGKTSSLRSSTSSSRLKQWNQRQVEDKKLKGQNYAQPICKKSETSSYIHRSKTVMTGQISCHKSGSINANRSQTSKGMVMKGALKAFKVNGTDAAGCSGAEGSLQRSVSIGDQCEGKALNVGNVARVSSFSQTLSKAKEPLPEKRKGDTHDSGKAAEANNTTQTSKSSVNNEASKSNLERRMQTNVDVSTQPEGKALSVSSTAGVSSFLQTPPKSREPVPENLRTRLFGLASAGQLDPALKGSQSGLAKAKEHPIGSNMNPCQKYYIVERLYNRRKGVVEEEFLVDLDIGEEPLSSLSSRVKKDGKAWWIPLSHFTKDKTSCHL